MRDCETMRDVVPGGTAGVSRGEMRARAAGVGIQYLGISHFPMVFADC